MRPGTYTVGELSSYIKELLEENPVLRNVRVKGELSNFTRHRSGHLYFSIRDASSVLNCVMFRSAAQGVPDDLKEGELIELSGSISVYLPRGNYQLMVKTLKRAGSTGNLFEQFTALKEKLATEGLFDPIRKRSLPKFPRKIGIVTSPTGAVIQDITNTLSRRYPHLSLILSPAKVQGEGALSSILNAMQRLKDTPSLDLVILARGGGSLEDLWVFNEEKLARTIYQFPVPVISAIGHETDFTISDFVADLRAPTPTAAAEIAAPDKTEILDFLASAERQIKNQLRNYSNFHQQRLDELDQQLLRAFQNRIGSERQQLTHFQERIQSLKLENILERGFSITLASDGTTLKSVNEINKNEEIETIFADGRIRSIIK